MYQQRYNYDLIGNIMQTEKTDIKEANIPNGNLTIEYTYNIKDALTKVSKEGKASYYTYNYDANSNRTKFTHPKQTEKTENKINEYDQIKIRYEINGRTEYDYDAAGNLVKKEGYPETGASNKVEYEYNYQDCLTKVKEQGQTIAEYAYDTSRQKISSHYPDKQETKIYHWIGGQIIGEETQKGTDSTAKKYIYNQNEKIAMVYKDKDGKEKIYYFINNLQGTPIFIVDEAGTIIHRQQTDAWGNIEYAYSIFEDEWNYTGKKLDTVTGLYYFNQRWYDPELGRFLTHDPAGQYANPYLYGGNNPLIGVDPNGLWSFGFELFGFGFNISDKGFSVGIAGFQLGTYEGNLTLGYSASLFTFGGDGWGVDLSVGYTHDFGSGRGSFNGGLGGNYDVYGGLGYSGGYNWDSASNQISLSGDWGYNAGDITPTVEHWGNMLVNENYRLANTDYSSDIDVNSLLTDIYLGDKKILPFPYSDVEINIGASGTYGNVTVGRGTNGTSIATDIAPSIGGSINLSISKRRNTSRSTVSVGFNRHASVSTTIGKGGFGVGLNIGWALGFSPINYSYKWNN